MNTLKKTPVLRGQQKKMLFPVSMILSALSALAGLAPYIIVWLIVRELFAAGGTISGSEGEALTQRIVSLAW